MTAAEASSAPLNAKCLFMLISLRSVFLASRLGLARPGSPAVAGGLAAAGRASQTGRIDARQPGKVLSARIDRPARRAHHGPAALGEGGERYRNDQGRA